MQAHRFHVALLALCHVSVHTAIGDGPFVLKALYVGARTWAIAVGSIA